MRNNRIFRRLFGRALALAGLGAAAVVAAPSTAAAQPGQMFGEEISQYRLTTAAMEKFVVATRALDAIEDSDVEIGQEFENIDEDNIDLEVMAAAFDREPLVRQAINGAGLTSREYLTFMFSMIQTMFAAAMLEMGGEDALERMEDSVVKQNIVFFMEHQEEFEAMGEEMEALNEDGDDDSDEDEDEGEDDEENEDS